MFEAVKIFFFSISVFSKCFVSVGELVGVDPVQRFPGTISTRIPQDVPSSGLGCTRRIKVLINLQPYAASKRREGLIIGDFPG